jgi:hypothetical protein
MPASTPAIDGKFNKYYKFDLDKQVSIHEIIKNPSPETGNPKRTTRTGYYQGWSPVAAWGGELICCSP